MENNVWNTSFLKTFGFEIHNGVFTAQNAGKTYTFHQAKSPQEFVEIQDLQREAWGWSQIDVVPTHILALMDDTGGGAFIARLNGHPVAFAAGFGGGIDSITGQPSLISSMLAIGSTDLRSSGIGKLLKIFQAHFAFKNGYTSMKWFYDPERGENASLNMRKLGARVEEFHINKYGEMTSQLYGPVPTDRFRAVWRFAQEQTVQRLIGNNLPLFLADVSDIPIATKDVLHPSPRVLVEISPDIDKEEEQDKIARRYRLRDILTHYFLEKRYIATEFITGIDRELRKNYYLLEL